MSESASKDELAQTATAPGTVPKGPPQPVGETLGRYRLEHMLGEGGMGVVHAAFDPDLERRVALKVLRRTDGGDDARQRLLREARAMARLSHPNVVAVHEVGTAGDRDYVAMELIDGETLADWLRGKRRVHDITQAFIAAGRGLAAAHAAGLVHRDFKPHNVLRHHNGRVIVTDFGLARGVESALALEATLRPDQVLATVAHTPSSLSELTATGSVLGTPAYMAPEQWDGGVVGPAADQFAFCVALWEALTGERPFRGKTLDELRAEVKRGVGGVDASKVPRRLRGPLRRGLALEARDRYPSMDALLDALVRADRRRSAFALAWRGALVVGTIGFVLLRPHHAADCEAPQLALGAVWSEPIAAMTPRALVQPFDKLAVRWTMMRGIACTADADARPAQLHCLDGALARFAAVRAGFARVPAARAEDALAELVDPTVCVTPTPPRLGLAATADTSDAFELLAKAKAAAVDDDSARTQPALPVAPFQAFAARPELEPCAKSIAERALALVATDYATKHAAIMDAVQSGELCSDDRVRAETLVEQMPYQFELPVLGPRALAAIRGASGVVARVAQIDLTSRVDTARAGVALQQQHWAEAVQLLHAAAEQLDADGFHRRAAIAGLEEADAYIAHGRPDDLAAARKVAARWLPVAGELGDPAIQHKLEREDAYARYFAGDLAGGHAELLRLWQPYVDPSYPHQRIEGDVVDAAGKPVPGAIVWAGAHVLADQLGVVPLQRIHDGEDGLRRAIADDRGHFVIDAAPMHGALYAQAGDLRSPAIHIADRARLAVGPTRTVSGTVGLAGATYTEVTVAVLSELGDNFVLLSPLQPDGSFSLASVSVGKVAVGVQTGDDSSTAIEPTWVPAGTKSVTAMALHMPASGRTLDVLARSEISVAVETAQIIVMPGKVHVTTVAQVNASIDNGLMVRYAGHVSGENVPRPALDQLKAGDLWARFRNVMPGELTVCSFGMNGDLMDKDIQRKLASHLDELIVRCVQIGADAQVVVVPVAPQKRFE